VRGATFWMGARNCTAGFKGSKSVPTCPCVRGWIEREREWGEVARGATFWMGARNCTAGFEGSQSVPTCPCVKG
jgi:hypothetical protein